MFANKKRVSARRIALVAAVHVLALCTAGAGAYVATAEELALPADIPVSLAAQPAVSVATQSPADLEQAFWVCDYVATTQGMDAAPVALCSEVTAALRDQRFGGDFGELLEWWRQNKMVAHGRLQAIGNR